MGAASTIAGTARLVSGKHQGHQDLHHQTLNAAIIGGKSVQRQGGAGPSLDRDQDAARA